MKTDLKNNQIAVNGSGSFRSDENFSGFEEVEEISIESFRRWICASSDLGLYADRFDRQFWLGTG